MLLYEKNIAKKREKIFNLTETNFHKVHYLYEENRTLEKIRYPLSKALEPN